MDRGLLLVRGRRDRVLRWVRRGTLPVYVVPGRPWTTLVPAGDSRTMAPYTGGVTMLAAHPLRVTLRPAIGLWLHDGRAVITCWRRRLRGGQLWVQWTPGVGAARVPGMPLARPSDLAAVTGFRRNGAAPGAIRDLLADPGGTAEEMLTDLCLLLGLPHAEIIGGTSGASLPRAELVAPADASVAGFDKLVADEHRLATEVEEGL
ncbi:hypothetical protein [Arsenicicoccus dermatophilus]|uniref:hypothetical protein n=1 Tax=Arsenicicoccus dermatophilus TaxID=1076331 RepID=UPI001F4C99AE|nr:hypothetical protein [Arsenicicoccus dermatophilus]MCH8613211.1 hypothetical protein [Arsenicicoccus dermatophilus]